MGCRKICFKDPVPEQVDGKRKGNWTMPVYLEHSRKSNHGEIR